MELFLHNTATRKKERFEPLDDKNVRVYVCGPTVYDFAHIGNGRTFTTFDQLFRLLRVLYGEDHVTFVRNITDIEDKIIERAQKRNVSIKEVTAETTQSFLDDMETLGLLEPTHQPHATDYIAQMLEMIAKLIEQGHAYEAEGHVLFAVGSMADYGKLSGRSTDELLAGARVEVAPYKRDPMDFVLWKPSDLSQPGWDSPWGNGRPGWHIECSAMSEALLGKTFDIHAGGVDLIFPHHENEVAQSTCSHDGAPMARYWLHGGFLQVEGEKMSKSLGNFRTVHDLVREWPGEAMRLHLFTTHYRQSMNFSYDGIREAKAMLDRWYAATADVGEVTNDDLPADVLEAMCDDMNTPKALTAMHAIASKAGKGDREAKRQLKAAAQFFGLLQLTPEAWASWKPDNFDLDDAKIEGLIEARNVARKAKDFGEADRIRDELAEIGIAIKDGADGTTWTVAQ